MSTDKAFSELALDFPKETQHRAKIAGHTARTQGTEHTENASGSQEGKWNSHQLTIDHWGVGQVWLCCKALSFKQTRLQASSVSGSHKPMTACQVMGKIIVKPGV